MHHSKAGKQVNDAASAFIVKTPAIACHRGFHTSCGTGNNGRTSPSDRTGNDDWLVGLAQDIATATADEPGQCGVAIIIDNKDTVAFNNKADYPMMSMFKLHEALAVCATLDGGYVSLPSGRNYSIAVFVKDYAGNQEDAERLIACISETVYNHLAD
ncbi:MAG: hypothetical protein JFT11_01395 [Muribaculaceae bacterium]|nr:hypothetical protein [Muribaculaceae bacterium]